jgi:hypothetical protein
MDPPSPFMSAVEIAAYPPRASCTGGTSALAEARHRMVATGQWHPGQAMGRRWPIGCVALEITQRCNLDCALCYLSESAEAVHDVPLAEVFRRIDVIRAHYGAGMEVQVTGGDPTLRRRDELVAIVRRLRERDLRPSLFTNGIRATRDLLAELAAAGLYDVAFHVDMTQGRRGYRSEADLNSLRRDYIERARGLGLMVIFNTTVFAGNLHELPALASFFLQMSDVVGFASFQLQADTGRGVLRERSAAVTMTVVAAAIQTGIGTELSFGFPATGHARCNAYALALVVNGRAYDVCDHSRFLAYAFAASTDVQVVRNDWRRTLRAFLAWALRHPTILLPGAVWAAGKLWQMRRDLVAAHGRVRKLSFFIHDFMDADRLEPERIEACAFMVATAEGMLPMCLMNVKRDAVIREPLPLGQRFWNPLTNRTTEAPPRGEGRPTLAPRRLKGRAKAAAKSAHSRPSP